MPMLSISPSRCVVSVLVLSSPAVGMKGTKVTWTKNGIFPGPSSRRIWRMASRNGSDSMSPTVAANLGNHDIDIVRQLCEMPP